jgi:8-oxo-dGTP pyrophosphatase MutT (NUDIX family)
MPNSPRVAYVDVLVLRGAGPTLDVLCLRRASHGRSPGSWEAVHGHIDPGETPVAAALREVREEAGARPARLYNLSRIETFYRHTTDEVVLIPVFAAFLRWEAEVALSPEHDQFEWLPPHEARARMSWPRVRRELDDVMALLCGRTRGGAGGYAAGALGGRRPLTAWSALRLTPPGAAPARSRTPRAARWA